MADIQPYKPASPDRDAADTSPSAVGGRRRRGGPLLIGVLVVLLIVLHQDYWFWSSNYPVFGMVPIGLYYHACLSLFASLVWLLATKIAWPVETIVQAQQAASGTTEEVRR